MTEKLDLTLTVNGREHAISVEPRKTLVDAIREDCGLTGTHIGCEHGVCGACTVIVGDEAVRSCLMFAVQAQGKTIRTVEGLAKDGTLHPLQRAFMAHHGLQCGFCTPGFLMLAANALEQQPAHRRGGAARRAVVEPLPLHRLSEHRQGGARGAGRDAAADAGRSTGGGGSAGRCGAECASGIAGAVGSRAGTEVIGATGLPPVP